MTYNDAYEYMRDLERENRQVTDRQDFDERERFEEDN